MRVLAPTDAILVVVIGGYAAFSQITNRLTHPHQPTSKQIGPPLRQIHTSTDTKCKFNRPTTQMMLVFKQLTLEYMTSFILLYRETKRRVQPQIAARPFSS